MKNFISINENELILNVKISANARNSKFGEIEQISDDEKALRIYIKAKPVDGEANKEIINFLSKSLKIPKTNIEIISGITSKIKRIKLVVNNSQKENIIKLLL